MTGTATNPEPSTAAAQQGAAPLTAFVAPTTTAEFNTLGERLVPKACFKVEDLLFDFASSFIRPDMKDHLPELAGLRNDHKIQDLGGGGDIFPPLSIFGHADPVGTDDFNKVLSGRRATAFYAMLVRDTEMWETLFSSPVQDDKWGTRSIQTMLSTVQEPISIDGIAGDETAGAVRDFQSANGLKPDGDAGPVTRKALFKAYMDALCGPDLKLDKTKDFLARNEDGGQGKGDFQGCSRFNPLRVFSSSEAADFEAAPDKSERNQENAPNRRVVTLLFAPGRKVNPSFWPCPRAKEGIADCKKRLFPDADIRRNPQASHREFEDTGDTFGCRFYQIISDDSPCERVKPLPVLLGVNPLIAFSVTEAVTQSTSSSLVDAAPVKAGAIAAATSVVVVKKPQSTAARVDVDLKTDTAFDGIGTFTVTPNDKIRFFLGARELRFNGKDNVFGGAELTVGVTLFAEGAKASASMNDVTLTLTLTGGSKTAGPPAKAKMTAVEVTLDILEPRTSATTDPPALAQPPEGAAPAKPTDKVFLGRGLPEQDDAKTFERAIVIVRQVKPSTFNGSLVLTSISAKVKLFTNEVPVKDEISVNSRFIFPASDVSAADKRFFAEGVLKSAAVRDTGFQLGVKGIQEDADHVNITVVHGEIVSNADPKDPRIIARVPEKPERPTKSNFFPAPIIIGVNYDVQLRPFTQIPLGPGVLGPLKFQWTTPAPGSQLPLVDAGKEIVKLKAKKISGALNDITIDLIVTSDIGKFKLTHKLTIVNLEIDPVITGDNITPISDINLIRNPSVTALLLGSAASDKAQAAKIEITKITPTNLSFTFDDPRIAWWIIGGETPSAGKAKYEGRADFLSDEESQRGTRVQIAGSAQGDILVQPYSGGFGYGMFRTNVNAIHKIKYRVNRISSPAVPKVPASHGHPPQKAKPERRPTRSHVEARLHILITNVYLRQIGIELIPDDSSEVASHSGNDKVGLAVIDPHIVSVAKIDDGHFDVVVDLPGMTFRALNDGNKAADGAVRVNARNEIVVFAYIHSLAIQDALAQTQLSPGNHAAPVFRDSGIPSSSLTLKTGIPGSTPVKTLALKVDKGTSVKPQPKSPAKRDIDLLWGIVVPTFQIDDFNGTVGNLDICYASTLAHELGHVLGLNHRVATGDDFPDGLTTPGTKNLMFPGSPAPANLTSQENFDIIQAKAIRFSEVLARNP